MAGQLALNGGAKTITGDFPAWPQYSDSTRKALIDVLESGKWGKMEGGGVSLRFEERFAKAHGCKHAVAVVNGTVAIKLALQAAGIQTGDEVIVPPFTFVATASAVIECNATPVFVDLDPATYNIDPRRIEEAITEKTRAIIPVHFAGLMCDMDAIMAIAKRHNIAVIEDACHAHGSAWKGRPAGSIGAAGCFSFQSSKNMSAGEGGIITTNDDEMYHLAWSGHNCGREPGDAWYMHYRIAGNYRISEFQSAVLNDMLDHLEELTARRDQNGLYLTEKLRELAIPGIVPQARGVGETRHAHHLFVIRLDEDAFGLSRERFIDAVAAEGAPISKGYPLPLYHQPMFKNRAFGPYDGCRFDPDRVDCPVADRVCYHEGTWMPQRVMLGTREQMDQIAEAIARVNEHRNDVAGTPARAGA